jgi:acetoacetyl-CoA synthetase
VEPLRQVREGDLLWTPGPDRADRANVTAFTRWLSRERGLDFAGYDALWHWSVTDLDGFWQAVWRGVSDRFGQLAPKVLFCVDSYRYGGQDYDRSAEMAQIIALLPGLEQVVHVPGPAGLPIAGTFRTQAWDELMDHLAVPAAEFEFEQVPFGHPLWILFSSGTTGLPKAITHSHGGILIEQLKLQTLNMDLRPADRLFFYTTAGWMMWNFLVSSLLLGVRPLLYDGNPAYPDPGVLWEMAQNAKVTLFGASPAYVDLLSKAGLVPAEKYDLSALEAVMLAGSPVSAQCAACFYRNVKRDLWLHAGSGGTDVCTGFTGGAPTLPVYAGEHQARNLGVSAFAFNDQGEAVTGEVGEMVITQPMPSMPVRLWNDDNGELYRRTYFDDFPGVWRQGDFFKVNVRGGCFVLGRSDATLNRFGIRIGTAEIYAALESVEEVADALIVNLDLPGGGFFMPLFVTLAEGAVLDDALRRKIGERLRTEYTARHVPDQIIAVSAIPATLTGKKMEVPVRKILLGARPDDAANRNAMANPQALDAFARYASTQQDYRLG